MVVKTHFDLIAISAQSLSIPTLEIECVVAKITRFVMHAIEGFRSSLGFWLTCVIEES